MKEMREEMSVQASLMMLLKPDEHVDMVLGAYCKSVVRKSMIIIINISTV